MFLARKIRVLAEFGFSTPSATQWLNT